MQGTDSRANNIPAKVKIHFSSSREAINSFLQNQSFRKCKPKDVN